MATRRHAIVLRLLFSFVCLLLVSTVVGGVAHAQDYEAAGKHYAAGKELVAQKRFHQAALHFQAAYDITKDPVLLFDTGSAWEHAGERDRAVASYRQYLKEKPTAQDRSDVEERIQQITRNKTALTDESIEGDKAEADRVLATNAPPPLPEPVAKPPEVPVPPTPPAGQMTTPEPAAAVAAPVQPAAPPAPAAAVVPAKPAEQPAAQIGILDDRPQTKLRIAAWSCVAATIALLTTGAILGLAAQSRGDEITRRLNFTDSSGQPLQFDAGAKSDFQDLRNQGKLYNGISIGFYTAAAVAAVATTTLFIVDWKHRKNRAHAVAAPFAGPSGGGLVVGGAF